MGEEEVNMSEYGGGDDDRVSDWELGLPSADDLTPLSHLLISPELASAFSISPEPRRSMTDVNRASRNTLSSIRGELSPSDGVGFKSFDEEGGKDKDGMVVEGEESDPDVAGDGSGSRKARRIDESCDEEMENGNDGGSARTQDSTNSIKSAVPKTIMQLMNVEGLTRENVASHLQKYRLYLKRMQGLSNEGPSSSDPLFSSTPVPQSLNEARGSGHVPVPMPMPIQMTHPPQMMRMAVMGMAHGSYQGYESSPYNMLQQRDWSGSKFGSIASYQHVTPNDK
ncbi:hypothetical protein RHSIM_Rhsim13G0077900 [Rhododendron simsii]|uniref:Uncharacterized protein n=1 Tax=Rhododendron simsii TaxID=118357 RepID=A0A834FZN9_RHOSS|nr:hypothetical protein RHSIM_Rhsim13G0077900 [Rhododendron simsii]